MALVQRVVRWSDAPGDSARLLAFRALCGIGTILGVYVAAALGQAHHAGWVAAGIGVPAGILAALLPRAAPDSFLSFAALPRSAPRADPRVLLPVAAALALLVLLPVLLTKLPAFDDYANHLARAYVILRHGGDPLLDRFYAVRWHVGPNLVLDLLLPPLAALTGLYTAGKLFVVGYTLLLLAGPFAIHVALYRRWSFGPLLAVPFAYTTISKWGVMDYEAGLGLALFATAAWIAVRPAPGWVRGLLSFVCVMVLFACHLVAVALYALAIGSFELWRTGARRPRAGDVLALVLPFAPVVPLLLLLPRGAPAIPWHWGDVHARLDALRYVVEAYFPTLDLLVLLGLAGGLVAAVAARAVRLPAFGWFFLGFAALLFLLTPETAIGPWEAVPRLPIGVAFFLIGMLQWDLGAPRPRHVFLVGVVALALLRMTGVAVAFRDYARIRADFETSLPLIAPGSRILVADDYANQPEAMAPLKELACLATIARSSLVSIEYANPYKDVLVVRPRYRAATGAYNDDPIPLALLLHPQAFDPAHQPVTFAPSGRLYWADWARDDDYVYVMNPARQDNPDPARLALLFAGNRFQLYRVRRADGTPVKRSRETARAFPPRWLR